MAEVLAEATEACKRDFDADPNHPNPVRYLTTANRARHVVEILRVRLMKL